MRFRRPLTASSAHVRVTVPVIPRYLQWLLAVLFLGLSAAAAWWAFDFGKTLASHPSKVLLEEVKALRLEVANLRSKKEKTEQELATSDTLLVTEQATLSQLSERIRTLEQENQSLQEDLRFFEKLIPTDNSFNVSIRGLKAEMLDPTQLRWQVLLIQATKNPKPLSGKLILVFTGSRNGAVWNATLDEDSFAFELKQYKRMSGIYKLPEKTVVRSVTAKVLQNGKTKTVQTIKL